MREQRSAVEDSVLRQTFCERGRRGGLLLRRTQIGLPRTGWPFRCQRAGEFLDLDSPLEFDREFRI